MPTKKKQSNSSLGRTLIRQQETKRNRRPGKDLLRHTVDINEGEDAAKVNVKSVTEESSLQNFLSVAELAGTQFTAERENVKLVDPRKCLLTEESLRRGLAEDESKPLLCVPRRPLWDKNTSPELLAEREYQSFLEWRRQLALLEEKECAVLTPFERNLEFWRQLWRVIEKSDVIVQIVDARNPLLFYCEDLTKYALELNSTKKTIILLNKADYLTEVQRKHWLDYFKRVNITIVFFSAIQESKVIQESSINSEEVEEQFDDESATDEEEQQSLKDEDERCLQNETNIISTAFNSIALNGSTYDVLSRDELIQFFKTFKNETEKKVTIGFVGYPNVGKSSTINAILQHKKVSVSATPGRTKHFQTIEIDDELCLCDCPGLVFPKMLSSKAEMIINGVLPVDQMTDCRPPVALIVQLIPRHIFEQTYSILLPGEESGKPLTCDELLSVYGLMRGFMTQRGLPDNSRAARHVIKDFINGRLLYCFAPPNVDQKSFHVFPAKPENMENHYTHITAQQKKLMRLTRDVSEADFDRQFFKERNTGVHAKGVKKIGVYYNQLTTNGDREPTLPPKKHFNRKKKEKLRRVYAYLDVK